MNKTVLLCVVLAGCAGAPGPCPEGQARDNAGQCVAIAVPQQSLEDFDPFPQGKSAPANNDYANAEANPFARFDPQPTEANPFARFDPSPAAAPTQATPAPAAAQAAWAADNARRQQAWQAEWDERQAQFRANERTDRIVDAQRDTQHAVQELSDKVRQ